MSYTELILNGQYNYKENGNIYSEEVFKVLHEDVKNGNFIVNSEVSSRVKTGEFLQVFIEYHLNSKFEPITLSIRRSLGRNYSVEKFKYNNTDNILKYTFRGSKGEGKYEKNISSNFFINAPCVCTSMMMTVFKKVNPIYRTRYDVISTNNIWSYDGHFTENSIFVEQVQPEPVGLLIGNRELKSQHFQVYQHDKGSGLQDSGIPFYLSKFIQIPYRVKLSPTNIVEIEFLKNNESEYKKLF